MYCKGDNPPCPSPILSSTVPQQSSIVVPLICSDKFGGGKEILYSHTKHVGNVISSLSRIFLKIQTVVYVFCKCGHKPMWCGHPDPQIQHSLLKVQGVKCSFSEVFLMHEPVRFHELSSPLSLSGVFCFQLYNYVKGYKLLNLIRVPRFSFFASYDTINSQQCSFVLTLLWSDKSEDGKQSLI